MRSTRSVLLVMELLGMLALTAILGVSFLAQQSSIEQGSLSNLESHLATVNEAIHLFMAERERSFQRILGKMRTDPEFEVVDAFSDLYIVDHSKRITRILTRDEGSLVFPGFSMTHSPLGLYLDSQESMSGKATPLMRSSEHAEPGIFLTGRLDEGWLVARLDVAELVSFLTSLADLQDSTLVIANPQGYVIAATTQKLPLQIIPDTARMDSPFPEPMILNRMTNTQLGNEVILITPRVRVFKLLNLIQSMYPWIVAAMMLVTLLRMAYLETGFITPVRRLAETIEHWQIDAGMEQHRPLPLNSKELSTVFSHFREKARSASMSLKALEASELALHAMNEELEQRVVTRTDELRKAYDFVAESEKLASLGRLVAGLAHEVNTPIGISITVSSYMSERFQAIKNEFVGGTLSRASMEDFLAYGDEALGILNKSLQRAADLIGSFKRIAVDQNIEERSEFVMASLLESCITSLRHELKQGNHRISVTCPPEIRLESYPGIIIQIFTNLIMNAVIHGFRGLAEREITIEVAEHAGMISISMNDDGIGMAEGIRTHIFEPFFTTNREKGGSGLGLSIVWNLVTQRLGGRITCESEPGNGTRFRIEIPSSSPPGTTSTT